MSDRMLLRASLVAGVPAMIEALGVTPGPLLRRAGFSEELAVWDRLVVSQAQLATLFDQAAKATGERHFGALTGRLLLHQIGPVSRALEQAATFAEALRAVRRPLMSMREGVVFGVVINGPWASVTQQIRRGSAEETQQIAEAAAHVICTLLRERLDPAWRPLAIHFPHRAPADGGKRLTEMLRAPLRFAAGPLSLVFPTADLLRPLRPPRQRASAPLLPDLAFVRDDTLLMQQLDLVLEGMLAMGDLSFDRAAQTLGLSGRTLQLRLARLGETFSALVEQKRQRLAERWLSDGSAPITDVAMLLGYSDAANFTRAFRRWTGQAPRDYRREIQGERSRVW